MLQHVRIVLQKLREKDLPVKLSKCEFHKHSIGFLGYIVSDQGLKPDPKKVDSVKEWPTTKKRQGRSSLPGNHELLQKVYRKILLDRPTTHNADTQGCYLRVGPQLQGGL